MDVYTWRTGSAPESGVQLKREKGRRGGTVMLARHDGLTVLAGMKDFAQEGTATKARLMTTRRGGLLFVDDWKGREPGGMLFFSHALRDSLSVYTASCGRLETAMCPARRDVSDRDRCQMCGVEMEDNVPRTDLAPRFRHPSRGDVRSLVEGEFDARVDCLYVGMISNGHSVPRLQGIAQFIRPSKVAIVLVSDVVGWGSRLPTTEGIEVEWTGSEFKIEEVKKLPTLVRSGC